MSLVVLVALLAPVAVDALWIRRTVLDTDAFMEQMSPLVHDPAVQQAVVARLDRSLSDVDVEARLSKRLPDRLDFLAAPIADGVQGVVHDATERVVTSDRFAELFNEALRVAHDKLLTVLTGEGEHVKVAEDGVVTLDLTKLRTRVVDRIESSKLGSFVDLDPDEPVELQITKSPELAKAQRLLRVLDDLGYIIPIVLAVLLAAAIWTGRDRRRSVVRLAVGINIAMIVHLVALALGRSLYLDAVTGVLDLPAAGAVYDLLVHFPRIGTRAVLLLSLVVWIAAVLAGPSRGAVRVRAVVTSVTGRPAGTVADLGPLGSVGRWVAVHHRATQGTLMAAAGLLLVSFGRITPRGVLWTAVALAIALVVVEILAAAGRVEAPPRSAGADRPAS
jgi:hypothetical protein